MFRPACLNGRRVISDQAKLSALFAVYAGVKVISGTAYLCTTERVNGLCERQSDHHGQFFGSQFTSIGGSSSQKLQLVECSLLWLSVVRIFIKTTLYDTV